MQAILNTAKRWKPVDRKDAVSQELEQLFKENPDISSRLCSYFSNLFLNQLIEGSTLAELFEHKTTSLKLLQKAGIPDGDKFFPLIIASYDSNSDFARSAKSELKTIRLDYEDQAIVARLYNFALNSRLKDDVLGHVIKVITQSKLGLQQEINGILKRGLESTNTDCIISTVDLLARRLKIVENKFSEDYVVSLLKVLNGSLLAQGWPKMERTTPKETDLRSKIYVLIGVLAGKYPGVNSDLHYMKLLLDSLEGDTEDFKSSILDGLSEVLPVLNELGLDARDKVTDVLLKYLTEPAAPQSCKYIAVRYGSRIAEFHDPLGRIFCLLGLNHHNRPDIIEEARRGLNPHQYWLSRAPFGMSMKDLKFPSFVDMINTGTDRRSIGNSDQNILSYLAMSSSQILVSTLVFLEQTLAVEASAQLNVKTISVFDGNWEANVETAISLDKGVRGALRTYFKFMVSNEQSAMIQGFLNMAFDGITQAPDSSKISTIWWRLLSQMPPEVIEANVKHLDAIFSRVSHSKEHIREKSARALAVIVTHESVNFDVLADIINRLLPDASAKSHVEKLDGRVMALALVISRLSYRGRLEQFMNYENSKALIENSINYITSLIADVKDVQLRDAGIEGVSQLAMFGVLQAGSIDSLKEQIINYAKDNERAIVALGSLSVLVDEALGYVDTIMGIATSRHIEFMFSSGEALSFAASGWKSAIVDRVTDIQDVVPHVPESAGCLGYVLEKVLISCKSAIPTVRKFSCIWLLSLTQYCGHLPEIRENLEKIHLGFMKFLSERDDFVQESASRGLGIVYEMGDQNLKNVLIKGLVSTFTSTSSYGLNAGTVSGDTQLFEPGVLDTGDGSVSTYKDILNLASEVGDPGLVYKFMALSAHSSLWASRKGAAFGLGSVLSRANLDDIFESNARLSKSLIPKLYRYRFDPNRSVRESMRGIWDALIKDKSATVNSNFIDILEELLKSMGDREWRVRQASASALADLLQGKRAEEFEDHLEQIWAMSFRAVDDIKESVRQAATELTRGLATSLVRQVDVESGASLKMASSILFKLIPFLTGNFGLQSDSSDIQSFALNTLLQLCKKGGKALKPYIPELLEQFLDLMSTLEPQAMNYLALNADKYGLTNNAIDASRMASLRSSPMMDVVEYMVDLLDDELIKQFVPKLSNVIKRSVGLPSKLASSRVLVMLTVRKLQQTTPYADSLLKACQSQLLNINDTISQSYAMSAGYMCRMASIRAVIEYEKYLEKLYFAMESEKPRIVAGYSVSSVSRYASDKFGSLASAFLPFVYIAKHDPVQAVKDKFDMVWSDNTGGSGAIKLYLNEISTLVSEHLSSQQWIIRQVAAQSIAEASKVIEQSSNVDADTLFAILLDACGGRSWKGKELVFDGLVSLAVRMKERVLKNPELFEKIKKVVVVEANRRNKEYQVEVLPIFGKFTGSFPMLDLYEIQFELVDEYLLGSKGNDEDEEGDVQMADKDGKVNGAKQEMNRNKILMGVLESFALVDINGNALPDDILSKLSDYLNATLSLDSKTLISWKTKTAVLNGVGIICDKLKVETSGSGISPEKISQLLMSVWRNIMSTCAKDLNHEKVRTESARAASMLLQLSMLEPSAKADIVNNLKELVNDEKSTVVIAELKRILEKKY